MATVTFSGIASGIDFDAMVNALIEAERQNRITPIENQISNWEQKLSAVQEINSKLLSFYSICQSMDTEAEFLIKNATSSDETILTAYATSEAQVGNHSIVVNQLAKVEKEVHTNGEASQDTVVNNSGGDLTFKYQYAGGSIITVTVPDQTTLSGLKDLINNDPNNPGVTASILYDGTNYHLVLTGNDMGANNTIVVDPDSTATLTNYQNGSFTESQTASNAQIRVDGYPPDPDWIERTTNEINDVIEGVTLSLKNTGTASITISIDKNSITEKVNEWLDAFNEVRSVIKQYTYYDPDSGEAGVLNGNYATQIVKSRLDRIVVENQPGFLDGEETYINLSQLGFYTDTQEGSETQGLLLLDESVFNDALNDHPEALAEVFSANFEAVTNDNQITYYSHTTNTKPGIYEVEIDIDNAQGRFKPQGEDWHPWVALEGSPGDYYLTGESGYKEEGLAIHTTYSSGTHTAQIRLKNGVATELSRELKDLTSASSGPFNIIDEHYNEIIESFEQKIERQEEYLEQYENRLRESFSRLEAFLSRMDTLSSYLTQLASQATNNQQY
ncbi:MAG TPA: hypothetical protein ENI35_06265 [Candidatus Desulfofervidus auxilii]|uniref:Flagellar hook-associated protein 2 n=1 Tax=Desulfofervidus auxilii TaxID=1621989 RepID=A0A7C2A4S7_DESA2|nr:hypothetical protein [Candidatus Desulfofervidus auxilii]